MPCLFLLQEYASGGSLEDLLCRGMQLAEGDIWSLFADALAGVGHLHSHGIVHRDLKPSNLLLQPRELAVSGAADREFRSERIVLLVGDLGSVSTGNDYHADPCRGMSAEYIAPELMFDDSNTLLATVKSDSWALGITLYRMAYSNSLPWQASHSPDSPPTSKLRRFVSSVRDGTFVFPAVPNRSTALKGCIASLLHPDPSQRVAVSTLLRADFIRALRRARAGDGAPPQADGEIPSRSVPQHSPLQEPLAASGVKLAPAIVSSRLFRLPLLLFAIHCWLVLATTPETALSTLFAAAEITSHVFTLVRPSHSRRERFATTIVMLVVLFCGSPSSGLGATVRLVLLLCANWLPVGIAATEQSSGPKVNVAEGSLIPTHLGASRPVLRTSAIVPVS